MKKTVAKSQRARFLPSESNNLIYHSDESGRQVEKVQGKPADDLRKVTDFIKERKVPKTARSSRGAAGTEPVFSSEPLIAYKYDPGLARREEIVVTVKTTFQLGEEPASGRVRETAECRGVWKGSCPSISPRDRSSIFSGS